MQNILDTLSIKILDTPKWHEEKSREKFVLRSFWSVRDEMQVKEIRVLCDKWEIGQKLIEFHFLAQALSWSRSSVGVVRERINLMNEEKADEMEMFFWFIEQGVLFTPTSLQKIELTYIDSNGLEKLTNLDENKIKEVRAYTYANFYNLKVWQEDLNKAIIDEIGRLRVQFSIINEAQKLEQEINTVNHGKNIELDGQPHLTSSILKI